MKRTYSVGDNTKSNILSVFRKLFYENGISTTSYSNVCSILGIHKGLIAYHFPSKYSIAKRIFDETEEKNNAIIQELYPKESKTFQVLTSLYLFHLMIRENKNYLRFCKEVFNMPEYALDGIKEQEAFLLSFLDEAPYRPTAERLHTICTISNGIEKEIINNLYSGYLTESAEVIFDMDAGYNLRQFHYDEKIIHALFEKIFSIPYRIQMSDSFEVELINKNFSAGKQ